MAQILRGWLHELLVEAASTIFCLALVLATAACASLRVADTQPLSPAKLEPLGADRISKGGYRVDVLPVSPDAPDLSGGGKRSASFGYGALEGMRDQALRTKRYLDADQTEYLHLSDGGVSDNLAMRSAGGMMQALSASGIRERGYQHIRRLLVISVDGQGTQDSSVARRKEVGGLFAILGLVSGAQIDSYNFETLTLVSQQIQAVTQLLRQVRCGEAPVIDNVRCDDVKSGLIHVSLAGLPETPEKDKLLAIPTGLTLQHENVDLLVRAGHDAVMNSAELRAFLDDYRMRELNCTFPGAGATTRLGCAKGMASSEDGRGVV